MPLECMDVTKNVALGANILYVILSLFSLRLKVGKSKYISSNSAFDGIRLNSIIIFKICSSNVLDVMSARDRDSIISPNTIPGKMDTSS